MGGAKVKCVDGWVLAAPTRTEHADPFFPETYDYEYAVVRLPEEGTDE
jgi:hypothetical protein